MPVLDGLSMEAEQEFLTAACDKVGIYQLKHDEKLRDIQFESMEYLLSKGFEVDRDNYNLIYVMDLAQDMDLEDIWVKFNTNHPDDFRGHSLSMSDVVVMHRDGENKSYYVDRVGYAEQPGFLEKKDEPMEIKPEISLYVAGCSEFHDFGPMYEGYTSANDAIAKYNDIYLDYTVNVPGIGINIHMPGTKSTEDIQWDVLVGNHMDLETLSYIGEITENEAAMDMIAELYIQCQKIELWGELTVFDEAVNRCVERDIRRLAEEIDQFSQDVFPYEYADNVADKEANIATIEADIAAGKTEYMINFLNGCIEDFKDNGVVDVSPDATLAEIEAVENMRKAEEIVQKLEQYKPLAKVEELEEQNYNMIDNRLNNGFGEKQRKEEEKKETQGEKKHERISIASKLEEKKAEVKKRDAEAQEKAKKKDLNPEKKDIIGV